MIFFFFVRKGFTNLYLKILRDVTPKIPDKHRMLGTTCKLGTHMQLSPMMHACGCVSSITATLFKSLICFHSELFWMSFLTDNINIVRLKSRTSSTITVDMRQFEKITIWLKLTTCPCFFLVYSDVTYKTSRFEMGVLFDNSFSYECESLGEVGATLEHFGCNG
jgi:hypothetical protein